MTFSGFRLLLAGASLASGMAATAMVSMTRASASTTHPVCLSTQLEVAVAWGPGAAAGHIGVPFIIINTGKSSCTLEGYPKLIIGYSYKKRPVKVVDGGGMVYGPVKPRVVTLRPDGDASFGFNYVDAANQQDPNGPACTAQYVEVALPVRDREFASNFDTTVIFNFCYSDFEVGVTSIQAGPSPKEG
jgi:hypothetical protein